MRKFRKKLAVGLAVAMLASCFSFSGYAETEVKKGWVLTEEGEWMFFKSDGTFRKNKLQSSKKEGDTSTYYLQGDGFMISDEMREISVDMDGNDENIEPYYIYAFPSGQIAKNKWVQLDDEGHMAKEGGSWYYFDGDGKRVQGTTKVITEQYSGSQTPVTYYFEGDGKMVSDAFCKIGEEKYYFAHEGNRAEGKWLYIDNNWYLFNGESSGRAGSCVRNAVASDSNAQYEFDDEGIMTSDTAPVRNVDTLTRVGEEELLVPIGDKKTISFDVELATDSNASMQEVTIDHDFWVEDEVDDGALMGAYKRTYKLSNGQIKINFMPKSPCTVTMTPVMDGVKGDSVTVRAGWGAGVKAEENKEKAVEDLLSNVDTGGAVEALKTLNRDTENAGAVKKALVNNPDKLKLLEADYIMINKNVITQTTTDIAKTLLKSKEPVMIGGSLNAGEKETVELKVDQGETVLPEKYGKQVTFALDFLVAGTEKSELEVPIIITMQIPEGVEVGTLEVYHILEDGTPDPLGAIVDVEKNEVTFAADSFSDYVFGKKLSDSEDPNNPGTDPTPDPGKGGGSGSSSGRIASTKPAIPATPGSWNKLINGTWQFRHPDGAPYQSTWIYVKDHWYWIDATGIMQSGWQNINGKRYYLDENGAMKTGWVSVEGVWYYLAADGAMMVNATTPDGYKVDTSGVWVK